MLWTVETLDPSVDAELDALPVSLRARILRLMEMIEAVGLENVREPHVKHIEGKLWELRQRRNRTRHLRDRNGPEGRHASRLRQEVRKDAAQRSDCWS